VQILYIKTYSSMSSLFIITFCNFFAYWQCTLPTCNSSYRVHLKKQWSCAVLSSWIESITTKIHGGLLGN